MMMLYAHVLRVVRAKGGKKVKVSQERKMCSRSHSYRLSEYLCIFVRLFFS